MRYYHGGRNAVDPTKHFPEALTILDEADETMKKATEEERQKIVEEIAKAHPLTSPAARDSKPGKNDRALVSMNGQLMLKKPLAFCQRYQEIKDDTGRTTVNKIQEYIPWIPGSIVLALIGHGHFVIPPGGHIDLDSSIPESLIKSYCPHLLNEAEYAEQQAKAARLAAEANPKTKPKTESQGAPLQR